MFCSKCGAHIEDNVSSCGNCGAPTQETNQTTGGYQLKYPLLAKNLQPMKWFKFLIYFALFASAFLNAVSGVLMLTGAIYQGQKDLVYNVFSGLQTLDVIMGIGMFAMAALAIYTRFRLAGYYKNGPQLLSFGYLGGVILNVVYIAGLYIVVPEVAETLDLSSTITSCITSVCMVFVNKKYFRKRDSLFVNE